VPSRIIEVDGIYYVEINSLTNSTYSVIWNPKEVASVENHWSKVSVNDMASRLIVKSPETFKPDASITRGDFAEYITKALGIYRTNVAIEGLFSDVSINHELADAITIAVEYDIVSGYPDGTFRPEATITREEAMSMYSRAMLIVKLESTDLNRIMQFDDVSDVAQWAIKDVTSVLGANVFNGRSPNLLEPKSNLTYAEAATAIRNLLIESGLINE
jgi:hypothetical protein